MSKKINLPDELAKKLGKFTNKDETWADGLARAFAHMDEEAVVEDRNHRRTVYSGNQSGDGDNVYETLSDGTTVRHKYRRGDYAGDVINGTIQDEKIIVEGDGKKRSFSGAAKFADNRHRGEDARDGGWNGWEWWEFQNDDGEWVELLSAC